MDTRLLIAAGVLFLVGPAQAATDARSGLPVKGGRPVVATVNRDAISLDEFIAELDTPADRARLQQGRGTADELKMLERLITVKLVVQEATTMGIDGLPEIRKQVEVTSREILREVLVDRLVKDIPPDTAAVERRFRESVKEWKTVSLLFEDEAAAGRVREELAAGKAFDAIAATAVAAKAARKEADDDYHSKKDFLPAIADAVAALRPGQVSPVVHLPAGFAVIKVVDVRYPENRQARLDARNAVLLQQREAFMKRHGEALRKQYAHVDTALLASINYEAERPGVDALLKDSRVVARIAGAPPVTVADLTDYLRMQFFHGSDAAKQHREMNQKKGEALEATLGRRLLNLEASRLGIDRTNAYRDRIRGFEDSLVFNAFVDKVIAPDNKMTEPEVKNYYAAHVQDYSYPEMLRVRGLAFARRDAAEAAIRKLREGTDYAWIAANADGRVDVHTPGLLILDGQPVMTDAMPAGVKKAVAGAKAGDLRLYASPEGPVYVLSIQQVIPPSPKPYADVREDIARKLYGEKLDKSLDSYAARLRARSTVATYLKKV